MQLKQNKKGMTLIEIVVVLLISTIIMSIVGSMILSSMGYFSEEVVSQQDKEGLIDISSYIRKELSYATDVRVAIETEERERELERDGWHWLSIKEGKLYKDDGQLLSDNYYQNRKITVKVHGFDNYRLDINLKYLDNANKAVASNKTSLELMNLKADKDVVREYAPFSTAMDINETQKIYYIIKEKVVKPEIEKTGTVADQIAFLNNYNNREVWIPNARYRRGDMVFVDGYWWYCLVDGLGTADVLNTSRAWKKIDAYYDRQSGYQAGDIIIYEGNYYSCKRDITPDNDNPLPNTEYGATAWEKIVDSSAGTVEDILKGKDYENSFLTETYTVRNTLGTNTDSNPIIDVAEFDKGIKYKAGSIVKIYRSGFEGDNNLALYFECVKENPQSEPVSGDKYEWKYLSIEFNPMSAYDAGDVVFYTRDNGLYIEAVKNVRKLIIPSEEIDNKKEHWKKQEEGLIL